MTVRSARACARPAGRRSPASARCATRELKGLATQQPTCQSRLDGIAPCPINQAGDHFQVAFTVSGHGGNKWYVTPFVGLFATADGSNPTPTPNPTAAPAPQPNHGAAKATSRTKSAWKVAARRKGKVGVVVSSEEVGRQGA